jgi:hypothetical protein
MVFRKLLIAAIFSISSQALAQIKDFNYELASYHAPILFHQVGNNPKGDIITRFDYDGDWVANNSWKNLPNFPTPAFAYYDVKETETHFFIHYGLYHPRDYMAFCIPWGCHENDLEGLLLTIQKDSSRFGTLQVLQTLAHTKIRTYSKISEPRGSPQFASDHPRVTLFVEKQGHGIYAWNALTHKKWNEDDEVEIPLESEALDIAQGYGPRWFVFHDDFRSDDPSESSEGIFSYDLLPIWENFWLHRTETGYGNMFSDKSFEHKGARYSVGRLPAGLAGQRWCLSCVSPPWGWHDLKSGSKRGDWFFDPAYEVQARIHETPTAPWSMNYLFNPYVQP